MRHILFLFVFALAGCNGQGAEPTSTRIQSVEKAHPQTAEGKSERYQTLLARPIPELGTSSTLTDDDYRALLTPEEFHVLRERGTERAFTGEYHNSKSHGIYHCRACNAPLFDSATKFDSKTGWPSYYDGLEGRVGTQEDTSHGMQRTEIVCAHCGSHLGHVFDDGPEPTGLRYCVNSLSLVLEEH